MDEIITPQNDPDRLDNKVIEKPLITDPKVRGKIEFLQPYAPDVDSIRCYDPGTTVDLKFDGWLKIKINGVDIKLPYKVE